MAIKFTSLVAIVILVITVPSASKVSSVVNTFGETDKGSLDPNRWTGEINQTTVSEEYCQHTWIRALVNHCEKAISTTIGHTVKCISDHQVGIISCSCVTHDVEDCISMGKCPYTCGLSDYSYKAKSSLYTTLNPLPNNISEVNIAMCGRLNRTGRMCSECMEGYSPLVYSYDLNCVRCTNSRLNWLKFIAIAFIPLTIFYFIVILFRINATNPYLYGFITFSQLLASPIFLRASFLTLNGKYKFAARIIAVPYGIWNLDFFRSLPLNICLDLTTLQTLALDYAIAVYPLVLLVITYILIELHARGCRLVHWLWRPFHRCCVRFTRIMDIQSSIIKAFATFLLLSYVKLLNATIDVLSPTEVYNIEQNRSEWYVYYDATYKYFSKEHLPYAIVSIVIVFLFVLSPLLLLIFYPMRCFQKYCCGCGIQKGIILQIFVDTFQGHYKDGTEPGTRDRRWFAAVYFLARIIAFYIIFGYSKNVTCFALIGLSLILLGIVMILMQPYKSVKANKFHTTLPFVMAFSCFLVTLYDEAQVKSRRMIRHLHPVMGIVLFSPILALVSYVVFSIMQRIYRKCKAEWSLHHSTNSEQQKLIPKKKNAKMWQVINIE